MIFGIITALLGVGKTVAEGWVDRKAREQQHSAAIAEAETKARIAALEKAQSAEIAWDLQAAQQASTSWKDEWFTILLSVPLILAFFPSGRDIVVEGFKSLETMPGWYVTMLSLAVAFAFGYRKLVEMVTTFRNPAARR